MANTWHPRKSAFPRPHMKFSACLTADCCCHLPTTLPALLSTMSEPCSLSLSKYDAIYALSNHLPLSLLPLLNYGALDQKIGSFSLIMPPNTMILASYSRKLAEPSPSHLQESAFTTAKTSMPGTPSMTAMSSVNTSTFAVPFSQQQHSKSVTYSTNIGTASTLPMSSSLHFTLNSLPTPGHHNLCAAHNHNTEFSNFTRLLCIRYHKLNAITLPFKYPIPGCNNAIDDFG